MTTGQIVSRSRDVGTYFLQDKFCRSGIGQLWNARLHPAEHNVVYVRLTNRERELVVLFIS
jgi:hypothetical protein